MPWDTIIGVSRSFAKSMASHTHLLAGTDAGVSGLNPGWSLHEELQMMVTQFERTPLEALQAATLHPASCLNVLDQYGPIEEGKKADLLLLNANPLQEITHTQKIAMVFKNGVPLGNDKRQELLARVASNVATAGITFKSKTLMHLNQVLKRMGL